MSISPTAIWADPARYWEGLTAAIADRPAPCAVLEVSAYAHNRDDLVRRIARARRDAGCSGKLPIRVASKSLRVRDLITGLAGPGEVAGSEGYAGVLAFTVAEANWLADHGLTDVVVGYPSADRVALRALASDEGRARAVTVMVDSVDQLDLIDQVIAPSSRPEIRVALEVDVSLRLPGLRVGVYRSPLRTPAQMRALAEEIERRPGFRLVGVMAYEAQIAGLGNRVSGSAPQRARTAAIAALQARSIPQIAEIRQAAVAAVAAVAELEFVNGGGTGSIESTAADPSVTEVAAGSGLFGPGLFDHYRAFRPAPAAAFALDVVRRPTADIATVLGGGWIASGPPESSRQPVPTWPPGLAHVAEEMAGEVQTPLRHAAELQVGDRVWFRHAKAGELSEHASTLLLVDAASASVVGEVATYRGEGKAFL